MMFLQDILKNVKLKFKCFGAQNPQINGLILDSREANVGKMFFAVKGTVTDGHQFISSVIEKGASAIVCSDLPSEINPNIAYILVDDVQQSVGYLAASFYQNPSSKLKLVGITGTNGKTTVTSILYQLFTSMGFQCGLISTVEYIIGKETFTSTHTTPNPIKINELMAEMVNKGCTYCFMEVSSHSVVQGRINGLIFEGGAFTNLSHDHLDYHKTFDNYIKAKKGFFDSLPFGSFALTNKDDKNGKVMLQNTEAAKYTYALNSLANFTTKIIESDFEGLLLKIDDLEVWFQLVGKFNAYNLLCVYGVAFLLGIDKETIVTELSKQNRVNGRFEVLRSNSGLVAIVDYAHTPDALLNVLETINIIRTKNEQLITVVGCGGNRDIEKRPEMGKIAAKLSNKTIFTSDNPRNELAEDIISQMEKGVNPSDYKKVLKIADRKEAIKTACMMSKKGDIILVAGKGHETYQEINGIKSPFDDRVILKQIFNEIE